MIPQDKLRKRRYDINEPVDTSGSDYDTALKYPPIAPLQEGKMIEYQPMKKKFDRLRSARRPQGTRQGNQGTL